MAQTASFVIVNDTGAAVRAQINQVLAALQTLNAGVDPPAATAPGMPWLDLSVSPPRLCLRNAADSAWEDLFDGGSY